MNKEVTRRRRTQKVDLEKQIREYKIFYKTYLFKLKNRDEVSKTLYKFYREFEKTEPVRMLFGDGKRIKLENDSKNFLQTHFNQEILNLYNKEFPNTTLRNKDLSSFQSFLGELYEDFNQLNEKYKKEWHHKTNFLKFLCYCLYIYGLHPNIWQRDLSFKRYNLILKHSYRSKIPIIDMKILMSFEQFDKEFLQFYQNQKPVKIKGKLIPFNSIHEVKITTTLLLDDEIELFALEKKFNWNDLEKDIEAFANCCLDETEKYHPNPFEEKTHEKLNLHMIEETKNWLLDYSTAYKSYIAALDKFANKKYERNLLDDLRHSLECFLKELLGNKKSLEHQLPEVGKFQKKRGSTTEVTNMFQKLLDYYAKYQNTYVKHGDEVPSQDIEFIIELTTTFMKYLVKK